MPELYLNRTLDWSRTPEYAFSDFFPSSHIIMPTNSSFNVGNKKHKSHPASGSRYADGLYV